MWFYCRRGVALFILDLPSQVPRQINSEAEKSGSLAKRSDYLAWSLWTNPRDWETYQPAEIGECYILSMLITWGRTHIPISSISTQLRSEKYLIIHSTYIVNGWIRKAPLIESYLSALYEPWGPRWSLKHGNITGPLFFLVKSRMFRIQFWRQSSDIYFLLYYHLKAYRTTYYIHDV